jgi:hypothetical protein
MGERIRRLRLVFPGESVISVAELLESEAPVTCRTIWEALPFEGELNHAIWSGPETYLPIDASIRIPPEHQTRSPLPGEIGFYAIDGGVLVDWPEDMAEVAFFYGRGSRPSMPDGPVAMNIFARIVENLAAFQAVCARIRKEGVKRLRVERES